MRRITIPIVAALLLTIGCGDRGAVAPTTPVSILDRVLSRPDVVKRTASAQVVRPDDIWHDNPINGHFNASRWQREVAIANGLLKEIEPELDRMTARQLLDSLKTYQGLTMSCTSGVAYCVYEDGNNMIIGKLKGKDKVELGALDKFADPYTFVFDGDQGPGLNLRELIQWQLLGQTNR